jgi:hypothetical protein
VCVCVCLSRQYKNNLKANHQLRWVEWDAVVWTLTSNRLQYIYCHNDSRRVDRWMTSLRRHSNRCLVERSWVTDTWPYLQQQQQQQRTLLDDGIEFYDCIRQFYCKKNWNILLQLHSMNYSIEHLLQGAAFYSSKLKSIDCNICVNCCNSLCPGLAHAMYQSSTPKRTFRPHNYVK